MSQEVVLSNKRRHKASHWLTADRGGSGDAWPAIAVLLGGGLYSLVALTLVIGMMCMNIGPDTGDETSWTAIGMWFASAFIAPLLVLYISVVDAKFVVHAESSEVLKTAGHSYHKVMKTKDKQAKKAANALLAEMNDLRPDQSDEQVRLALEQRCTVMSALAEQTLLRHRREKIISNAGLSTALELAEKYEHENEARKQLA